VSDQQQKLFYNYYRENNISQKGYFSYNNNLPYSSYIMAENIPQDMNQLSSYMKSARWVYLMCRIIHIVIPPYDAIIVLCVLDVVITQVVVGLQIKFYTKLARRIPSIKINSYSNTSSLST